MKLHVGEMVYLQKYDVDYIVRRVSVIPRFVFDEAFTNREIPVVEDEVDGCKFEGVFRDKRSIEWLMAQEWLVDFEKYDAMSLSDISEEMRRIKKTRQAEVDDFNKRSIDYFEKHYDEVSNRFANRGQELISLEKMVKYKEGKLKFGFPEGYRSESDDDDQGKTKRGFLARFFNMGAR